MAETVGPGRQRIKFAATRTGTVQLPAPLPQPLVQLSSLMRRLEANGMVPILDDGLVGGNCACTADFCGLGRGSSSTAGGSSSAAAGSRASSDSTWAAGGVLVSRSGKQPHAALQPEDWVLLTRFDAASWRAEYRSASEAARPSSDAPLHAAALGPGAAQRFGWEVTPAVAVHGHALASGAGLEVARAAGLPVSAAETLFSTPDDLAALEALFRLYPYPRHRCYIRRGHGFLLLHDTVEQAAQYLESHLLPLLQDGACNQPRSGCEIPTSA